MPNHPDAAFEYVKALRECGYKWLLVQEHTVETLEGHGLGYKHLPHRLHRPQLRPARRCRSSRIIKTQGSDTKLVAQMQPYYEAKGLQRRDVGGVSIPPLVTQIGDGENGGVMMNEFPSGYRQAIRQFGTEGVVNVNVTEYLEMIEQAGVKRAMLPACRPIHQGASVRPHHEVGAGRPLTGPWRRSSGRSRTSRSTAARGPTTSAGWPATRTC